MSIKTAEERFWAKVNKTATCWLWEGATLNSGHGQFNSGRMEGRNVLVLVHRYSYALSFGPIPAGVFLDHKCHVKNCVHPDHLRPATNKQNMENRTGPTVLSKSGVRGVYWHTQRQKWVATVGHNGKSIYAGIFTDQHEAELAARAKRDELFSHNLEGQIQ